MNQFTLQITKKNASIEACTLEIKILAASA
jgi:hypothetical protein